MNRKDEKRIRQIVREEIALAIAPQDTKAAPPAAPDAPAPAPAPAPKPKAPKAKAAKKKVAKKKK